jgi:hypothetical protein
LKFSDEGDSGSAIINAQGKIIAVLFGGDSSQVPKWTLASHIHPVLDFLKVTAITQTSPATGNPAYSSEAVTADLAAVPAAGINPSAVPALRERLNKAPQGAEIFKLIEGHATEVVHLVNHNRTKITMLSAEFSMWARKATSRSPIRERPAQTTTTSIARRPRSAFAYRVVVTLCAASNSQIRSSVST